jgi:hypothetical protein
MKKHHVLTISKKTYFKPQQPLSQMLHSILAVQVHAQ